MTKAIWTTLPAAQKKAAREQRRMLKATAALERWQSLSNIKARLAKNRLRRAGASHRPKTGTRAKTSSQHQGRPQSTPLGRKWTRIPAMSDRRRREYRIYIRLATAFIAQHPFCQRCGNPTQCVHHWAGRRSNYLKVETWRASCIPCNNMAKNHPEDAWLEGWIAPVGVYKV